MRPYVLAVSVFLATAVLVAALPVSAKATMQQGKKNKGKDDDGVIVNWGKPKDFEPGKPVQYWVWYDEGAWHLRTTTAKKRHKFTGRIDVVGGQLSALLGLKGEVLGKNSDAFVWNKERTAILIDFTTDGAVDGINFKVNDKATAIKFTLAIDGEAHPKHISIGKAGDHPKEAVFVLMAHPPEPKK